jgi:glycolate oxidase iron-sulfur subunit
MHQPEADLTQCVRCGLCLQHCPTYAETGLETESPRGRLYIMQALADGIIEPTANVIGHLDMCLQCRNCEAVCPSGVPFGNIMETARSAILESGHAPASWTLRSLFLREIVARPERLGLLARALRLTEETGLRGLAERIPVTGTRATLAPRFADRPFSQLGLLGMPDGEVRSRVAILVGCLMPLSFGEVHRSTVRVLTRNGCVVSAPRGQTCCGALHAHNGDLATARKLARRNIAAFEAAGVDAVIVNSAGCGAAMKEYGHLLGDDSRYADRAVRFSALVRDISEFLVSLPFEVPRGTLSATVTYQDSCHLAHAQRITEAPRNVLRAIPGLELVEMKRPDRCCGSAGVYSFTQPGMSMSLLSAKMDDIATTRAQHIATSNPGCIAQLQAGVRMIGAPGRVFHPVELLDRAYRSG